jgi:hypothetical protein
MPTPALQALLANPPKLHLHPDGRLINDWRIDTTTALELDRRLKPGLNTLETGAGFSTILFAVHGCEHTCIAPDRDLLNRIRMYCTDHSISTENIRFIDASSIIVVPQLPEAAYDLALIDGCHGFPTAFVDFLYITRALRVGGTLIIDDLHIYTCRTIALYMRSDPAWRIEVFTKRVAFGVKLDDTGGVYNEWMSQPFVQKRSTATSLMSKILSRLGVLH